MGQHRPAALWKEAIVILGLNSRLSTFITCAVAGLLVILMVKFFGHPITILDLSDMI
ncbi:MAG TPA: hypothetical protein VJ785_11680 [Anaerolineales bacterium]|nr:hypothetical protein [Anaerolineales bacterium]